MIDRHGQEQFLPFPEDTYGQVDISIDGRIAVHKLDVQDYIQIISEPKAGKSFRLEGAESFGWPRWSHKGDKIAFLGRGNSGRQSVLVKTIDLVEDPQSITDESTLDFDFSAWGPSDKGIFIHEWPSGRAYYLPDTDSSPMPKGFVTKEPEPFVDLDPTGKWIAAHNGNVVRVRSIDGRTEHTVSPGFATEPRWCKQCDELFYRNGNRFYSLRVRFKPEFQWEEPELIWEVDNFIDTAGQSFEVTPEGQFLLVIKREKEFPRNKVHVIQAWTAQSKATEVK